VHVVGDASAHGLARLVVRAFQDSPARKYFA
jgi:hypothetical protein